jgi:hypothetical protein
MEDEVGTLCRAHAPHLHQGLTQALSSYFSLRYVLGGGAHVHLCVKINPMEGNEIHDDADKMGEDSAEGAERCGNVVSSALEHAIEEDFGLGAAMSHMESVLGLMRDEETAGSTVGDAMLDVLALLGNGPKSS